MGSEAHCPGRLIVRDFYPSAVASVRSRLHDWADACRNYAATGSNEFSEKRSKFKRTFLIGNAGVGKVLLHCFHAPHPTQHGPLLVASFQSCFLGYILLQMAIDKDFLPPGLTLLFVHGSIQCAYELRRDGTSRKRTYDATVLCEYGDREDVVWLFDSVEVGQSGAVKFSAEVPRVPGHIIMAVSTNTRHWTDNGKDGNRLGSTLFFPDYAEAAAEVVFNSLLTSDAKDTIGSFALRFGAVGGNLWYLLDTTTATTQLMEGVMAKKDVNAGVRQLLRFVNTQQGQKAPATELWDQASTISSVLLMVTVRLLLAFAFVAVLQLT